MRKNFQIRVALQHCTTINILQNCRRHWFGYVLLRVNSLGASANTDQFRRGFGGRSSKIDPRQPLLEAKQGDLYAAHIQPQRMV